MLASHQNLALLAVAGAILTYTSAQGLNEPCTLRRSGRPGECRLFHSCPVVAQDAHIRLPQICGRRGREAIVCCPKDSPGPNTCSNSRNAGGIAAPPVSFECGVQASRTTLTGDLFRRRRRRDFVQPLVVGGVTSEVNAWPWMALLGELDNSGSNPDWFCAGSLLNEQWVISAAHCFNFRTAHVVRLGEHDYSKPNEAAHEDFQISQIINQPGYVSSQAYHDLALLKLDRKVTITNFIRPVCLPWNRIRPKRLVNSKLTVTGWGNTQGGGNRSPTLQEVEVTVFPSSRCNQEYSSLHFYNTNWPSGIRQETVCAGDVKGGKDACQGDSGGPAVHLECNRYTLAGVISQGFGCGLENYPGLYVNIHQPFYLQWIKETAF